MNSPFARYTGLANRVALVTGGASGIGAMVAPRAGVGMAGSEMAERGGPTPSKTA